MDGDEPARAVENALERLSLVHQQRPCGGTHEDLDAANAGDGDGGIGGANGVLQVADIVGGGADEEPVIVDALFRGGLEFGFHPFQRRDGGLVVGHVKKRGDAAAHGRCRTRTEVLFFWLTWIPEVDLRVDHTGHQVEPCPVDEQLVIHGLEGLAQCDTLDESASDSQIAHTGFTGEDHRCAVNQDVAGHVALSTTRAVFGS